MSAGGRPTLLGLDRAGLEAALRPLAVRPYVPAQVYRWLYGRLAGSFGEMTDLARSLRAELERRFHPAGETASERVPAADGTTRWVWRLADGQRTESVWIPGRPGQASLCLSSQVGCPLACSFCVSGVSGVRRNLSAGEILAQAHGMLRGHGRPARLNVVFMGMGEALLNLDEVVRASAILADPEGFGIAWRRMTLSTAGHVPALERFGRLVARPRLAVSLNATTDEVRDRIMPINRAWPLRALLEACRRFPLERGERITFEYVLLAGINDGEADARRLPKLLAHVPSKVNLIPWNSSPGLDFRSPAPEAVDDFAARLRARGLLVTVRRRRGAEAGAACGQLALRRAGEPDARALA